MIGEISKDTSNNVPSLSSNLSLEGSYKKIGEILHIPEKGFPEKKKNGSL